MKSVLTTLAGAASLLALPLAAPAAEHDMAKKDIVETAVADGRFTTLAKALEAAGLVDTLKGDGPFTVFAPTDAAFEKLPAGTVEKLLEPENKDMLIDVLQQHVVSGKVMAEQAMKLSQAEAINGNELMLKVENEVLNVGDAKVIAADVATENGVIHVIDSVLLPEGME